MVQFKEGVKSDGLSEKITEKIPTIDKIYIEVTGREATVTSTSERVEGRLSDSRHYSDEAIDLRTRDTSPDKVDRIVRELKEALGRDYDVVKKSNHIHVEYDPKRG